MERLRKSWANHSCILFTYQFIRFIKSFMTIHTNQKASIISLCVSFYYIISWKAYKSPALIVFRGDSDLLFVSETLACLCTASEACKL